MDLNLMEDLSQARGTPPPEELVSLNLNVLDGNSAAGSRDRGENAVLLNINYGGTAGVNSGSALGGLGTGESDSTKVSEGNQAAALLKVLNDPFSVVLAKLVGLAREFVGNSSTLGDIFNNSRTGRGAASSHGDFDNIPSRDGDASEIVGVVGIPLVPSIVADGAALNTKVDTSLENRAVASVTVKADPGRGAVLGSAAAAAGNFGRGNSELSGDGTVAGSDKNSASPVRAVLDLLGVSDVQLFHTKGIGHVGWV